MVSDVRAWNFLVRLMSIWVTHLFFATYTNENKYNRKILE